jgi:hypothetical protein
MRYTSTLTVPLQISKGAAITFSPVVEVSLACHGCCRANRTIFLSESAPAEHFGNINYDGHTFDGRIVGFSSDRAPAGDDADLITARYCLNYDFQPFTDAKYPERQVSPHPTWGRIHFTIRCTCDRSVEGSTQSNLVRPRRVRCQCGQILLSEYEQVILFSEAQPVVLNNLKNTVTQ